MIGERFNYEDVFFRDLTICVLDTLEGEVRWVNKFSSGDRVVNVPFYYSMTGDERFLLDSFTDDVVSNNRYVDLNTDIIPRGHLTLVSYEIRADEFANPNVWLKMVVENDTEIRNMLTKVRAIPITVRYDLEIHLSSEIDTFKCSQAILDTLWLYRFMYFEHNFMNIDAVMTIPDASNITINREKNLTSDNTIKLTVSFDVQTYYPAFRKPKLPNVLPYEAKTDYINQSLIVKVDLFKPNPGYFLETKATAKLIILKPYSFGSVISLYIDYPNPNSIIVSSFTFTGLTTNEQATELSNYINDNTTYSSEHNGSLIKVTAPEGSNLDIDGKMVTVLVLSNNTSVDPFSGGNSSNNATCTIIILNPFVVGNNVSIIIDYPNPNTHIVSSYTFTSVTSDDQAIELSDFINNTTNYTSTYSGSTIDVTAPDGSDSEINGKILTISGVSDDIKVEPFGGGNSENSEEKDLIYTETHSITTSSDGGMILQIGSGANIFGNYLSVNLENNNLKIDVYVNTNDNLEFVKIISGDNLSPSFTNEERNLNEFLSNSYDSPVGSDYRDTISLPKKTRWYSNLIKSRSTNRNKSTTPYQSQDLNNQKKL